jgi:hypothetical protein
MTRKNSNNAVDPMTSEALAAQGLGDAPGNGSGNNGKGPGTGLWGNDGYFEGMMKPQEMPSAIREFLHPGKDTLDLTGRTVFEDKNEAKLVTLCMAWAREFKDTEFEEDLKILMSANNSVHGYARDQAAQIATQTYRGSSYPGQKEKNNNNGGGFWHRGDKDEGDK